MIEVLSFSNVRRVGKFGLLGGCLIAIMAGCSSKLQTTVVSVTEPPAKPQVAKVEPEAPPVEAAVQSPVQAETFIGVPPMDIPVEEPARAVIRPSATADIFATPRTTVVEPAASSPLEAPLIAEPVIPPSPIPTTPGQAFPQESQEVGIPPIALEPEMPARPVIREDAAPPEQMIARVEPEADKSAQQSPALPEVIEKKTEALLKSLGDIYFDYDRFSIRADAISVLKENAQALASGLANNKIVIEGHCDQRGTESYNMVLGERRANAVREYLVDLGVPSENLQVVSYGKEKPFCTDQNEECWQENRRGHFVVQ
ncbi:OmpA family protein [Candidatus Nitrospira allomarina]|uniref:Peptidoglycan-associated protein n=1 Tax=Candidatus Nitrospira allomarina TaxID=3020900 RepID=A0AA96GD54_9BACT|nr:OmpA family protein [Candidatus Nitrospira allomarina]WNM59919.1 OmpA family protein [Candidatus Nitrospira allomarina]